MDKHEEILVSIVIPTYSRNITLTRAIESALNQTHENTEVIVVDDNPAESKWRKSTEELMQRYADNQKIKYIRNKVNMGGSGARNEGIKVAQGEYIAFLDDDDEYFPQRIEKQLDCFLNTCQKNLALVFCDAVMTFDNNVFVCNVTPRYKGCCLYEAMRDNCLAATSQWMAKKSALLSVGLFTSVPCKQDSTLILKLLEAGYDVECVPEILSKYCNYQDERISATGIKNLNGELSYRKKCRNLYGRLTSRQIREVEYSFAKRLATLYKANGKYEEEKKCRVFLWKTHPFRTLNMFSREIYNRVKWKMRGGGNCHNKGIIHVANYAACYRGNFIEGLECLDDILKEENCQTVYAFYLGASDKPQTWMKDMESEGKNVIYLSGSVIKDAKVLRKAMKKFNIKLVHMHFLSMPQYLSIRIAVIGKRLIQIYHCHNHFSNAREPKATLRKILYKQCFMLGCSQSVYDSISKYYPKQKKGYVDNGCYFKRVESLNAALRSEYNIKETSSVCLIFGFDFYRKGVDLALKAIEELNNSGKNIELLVSLSKNFDEVNDSIQKLLGNVPEWVHVIPARNDVYTLYNLADVFLSPSREEGLPYSVLEAAYCKCSIVMSDISAQKNLNIPYGIWFANENTQELEKAIINALEIKCEKIQDLDNVRNQMEHNYGLKKWSEEIKKVYIENGLQI